MDIISLGPNCSVKYQTDLFLKNNKKKIKETNFFDWLYSNFNSVINLLECNNIKDIINKKNILIKRHNSQKSDVTFQKLNNIRSIHDMKNIYDENDINTFVDKYIRRYERLITLIKNNNINIFIYNDYLDKENENKFIELIKKINSTKNFYLITISNKYPEDEIINNIINITTKNKILNKKYDWTNSHINWNLIFQIVFNLIKFDLQNID
jgi:hypothetical protein